MDKLFYTVKETAKLLRVAPLTVYRRTSDGKIPSVKIGSKLLVPASYIQSLIDSALEKNKEI